MPWYRSEMGLYVLMGTDRTADFVRRKVEGYARLERREESWRRHQAWKRKNHPKPFDLSDEDVREIRRLHAEGEMGYERLAFAYQSTYARIRSVVLKRTYKHVS